MGAGTEVRKSLADPWYGAGSQRSRAAGRCVDLIYGFDVNKNMVLSINSIWILVGIVLIMFWIFMNSILIDLKMILREGKNYE